MRILCIGDVVGSAGVTAFGKKMPEFRQKYSPDIVIVNGENAGDGGSITAANCGALFMLGADVITGGNHSLYSRDMAEIYEREDGALRPANLHPNAPGSGVFVYERGKYRCAVVSLIGDVFLDLAFESPFLAADRILKETDCKNIVVDIHGEATSEKIALGKYLDGRVSVVFGTHTHVQTNDNQILPNGTGYITDLGMTGPYYSVLGVNPECVIEKLKTAMPVRFVNDDGPCVLEGCLFEIDNKTGKTISTTLIRR